MSAVQRLLDHLDRCRRHAERIGQWAVDGPRLYVADLDLLWSLTDAARAEVAAQGTLTPEAVRRREDLPTVPDLRAALRPDFGSRTELLDEARCPRGHALLWVGRQLALCECCPDRPIWRVTFFVDNPPRPYFDPGSPELDELGAALRQALAFYDKLAEEYARRPLSAHPDDTPTVSMRSPIAAAPASALAPGLSTGEVTRLARNLGEAVQTAVIETLMGGR